MYGRQRTTVSFFLFYDRVIVVHQVSMELRDSKDVLVKEELRYVFNESTGIIARCTTRVNQYHFIVASLHWLTILCQSSKGLFLGDRNVTLAEM